MGDLADDAAAKRQHADNEDQALHHRHPRAELRHLRWVELSRHGYAVVSLDPERVAADWWHVDLSEGTERRAAS